MLHLITFISHSFQGCKNIICLECQYHQSINMYINIFFNILIYIQYYIFVSAINILSFGILAINIYLENLTLGSLESDHHHLTGV